MTRISKEKINTIKSNILSILYKNNLRALFTAEIAKIEARDEEFIKKILQEMKEQGFVNMVNMNQMGKIYSRRMRWRLNSQTYEAYKKLHVSNLLCFLTFCPPNFFLSM